MMKVDEEACIGCGACVSLCPDTFEMNEGKSHVKSNKDCDESISACPVNAISKE